MKKTPDKDLLPEYDFSTGVRGKYVARIACAQDPHDHRAKRIIWPLQTIRRGLVVLDAASGAIKRTIAPPTETSNDNENYTRARLSAILYF